MGCKYKYLCSAFVSALVLLSLDAFANAEFCASQFVSPVEASAIQKRDLRPALLGKPTLVESEIGPLAIGIVDVDFPGAAESISELLIRSISDARETNVPAGHLPDHLVDEVIEQYISPEKVKTLWRHHGHRFVAMNAEGEIIGTMLLGIDKDTLLYMNRHANNVPTSTFPSVKPDGYHQMMNLSVRHDVRRSKVASIMLDIVTRNYRHLFNGKGIWMRADPPWHNKLVGLGFQHDPSKDFFLPATVEKTSGMSHDRYNSQFKCSCSGQESNDRVEKLRVQKLQYFSFTRNFELPKTVRHSENRQVDVLILGGGISGTAFALKLRELDPNLKTLLVSKDSDFALSGQGHLYPMTRMEQFRFPGENSFQPALIDGIAYPGEVERALIQNQESLDIWNGDAVAGLSNGGEIVLKSGVHIRARAVVVATGMTPIEATFVDPSARTRVSDFLAFSREIARIPYVNSEAGSWGTVAIVGDGAAGRALAEKLRVDSYRVAKQVLLIGENASEQSVTKVSFSNGKFDIEVRDRDSSVHHYVVDRVALSIGYRNTESQDLAKKLGTEWVVGAAAFDGVTPPIVDQITHLSDRAIALVKKLGATRR